MKNKFKKYITPLLSLAFFAVVFFGGSHVSEATFTYYSHAIPYTVLDEPAITVSITAAPMSMTLPTNQTKLIWTTTGSPDNCYAFGEWSGLKAVGGGSQTLTGLTVGTHGYPIVCERTGSPNAMDTVYVTVTGEPGSPSPTATLTANPAVLAYPGGNSTLTWSSTNTTSCTGTNFNAGGSTGGTTQVSLTATKTYSVTCTGASGQATATTTVVVLPKRTDEPGGTGGGGTGSEEPLPACKDGKDNDGDKKIDYSGEPTSVPAGAGDPGCTSGMDNDERNIKPIYIEN